MRTTRMRSYMYEHHGVLVLLLHIYMHLTQYEYSFEWVMGLAHISECAHAVRHAILILSLCMRMVTSSVMQLK